MKKKLFLNSNSTFLNRLARVVLVFFFVVTYHGPIVSASSDKSHKNDSQKQEEKHHDKYAHDDEKEHKETKSDKSEKQEDKLEEKLEKTYNKLAKKLDDLKDESDWKKDDKKKYIHSFWRSYLVRCPDLEDDDEEEGFHELLEDFRHKGKKGYCRSKLFKKFFTGIPHFVQIDSPESGEHISNNSSTVAVTGTAKGPLFKSYQLFFRSDEADEKWQPIHDEETKPISKDVLGLWDISELAVGNYSLKLEVKQKNNWPLIDVEEQIPVELPIVRLNHDDLNQLSPSISGNKIVWLENAHTKHPFQKMEVIVYDLVTEEKINLGKASKQNQFYSGISGDHVLLQQHKSLFYYDLSTKEKILISDGVDIKSRPDIDAGRVVWQEKVKNEETIFLYDIDKKATEAIVASKHKLREPKIAGDKMAYLESKGSHKTLKVHDLLTGKEHIISKDKTKRHNFALSEKHLVFQIFEHKGRVSKTYHHNFEAKETKLLFKGDCHSFSFRLNNGLDVSGDTFVFTEKKGNNFDVYYFDLKTGEKHRITAHWSAQLNPAISNGVVVWQDHRNGFFKKGGNTDLYLYRFDLNTPPVLNVAERHELLKKEFLKIPVSASDSEGDAIKLTVQTSAGDAIETLGAAFEDFGNGEGLFEWTPEEAGEYVFLFEAIDEKGAKDSKLVSVLVTEPENELPTVSITSPDEGAEFQNPTSILVEVTAVDSDGDITQVALYKNGEKIGEATEAPYEFFLDNLEAGSCVFYAIATDNLDGVQQSETVSVTILPKPNEAPEVAITAPVSGDSFIALTDITITVEATDPDGTIAKVIFYNGNELLAEDTEAPYTFDWTDVAAANYILNATAVDDDGVETDAAPVLISVVPANLPPTVTLTSPSESDIFTDPASITVAADAADTDGSITLVEFFQDGVKIGEASAEPYSLALTNMLEGSYTFFARAFDDEGESADSDEVTIVVDPTPNEFPIITITSPEMGDVFVSPADVTITADASDSDGSIAKVQFFNGDALLFEDTAEPYLFVMEDLSPSNIVINAVAIDTEGAETDAVPVAITIIAPNASPTVTLTSPIAGDTFTDPASMTLSADAADSDGTIAKVEFYQNGVKIGESTSEPYTLDLTDMTEGDYTFFARAFDNEGESTDSASVTVTVDPTPNVLPTVVITSPLDGATFTDPADITITVDANDVDGTVTSVGFFNGVALLGEVFSEPFTFTWNGVTEGTYPITAIAMDNNGDIMQSEEVVIVVDPTPNVLPTVTLTSPNASDTFTDPASITLSADASDSDGTIAKVEFYQDGVKIGESTAAPYTLDLINMTEGNYTFFARAFDDDDESTDSASVAVTVDPTPNVLPSITITSPNTGDVFISPADIAITADASDSDGTITKVQFYNGSTLISEDTASPYAINWQNVAPGTYTINAVATDDAGDSTNAAPVTVTVLAPNQIPTATITSPNNGDAFEESEDITINATASDPDGVVVKVEFYEGSTKLGEDTTAPFSFDWTNVAIGTYSITAHVTDDRGATVISQPISITVNAFNEAPVITAVADKLLREAEHLDVTVDVSDAEGDPIQFDVKLADGSALPSFITFTEIATNSYRIDIDPEEGDLGDYDIEIIADDGNKTTTEAFMITVDNVSKVKLLLHLDQTPFADASTLEHPVTKAGNVTLRPDDKAIGTASAYFDGNGDYLEMPSSDDWSLGTEDFTIDFWIKPTGFEDDDTIISRYVDEYNEWKFQFYAGSGQHMRFHFFESQNQERVVKFAIDSKDHGMQAGQWYHIAIVRSGGQGFIFLNGVNKTSATSGMNANILTTPGKLYIGTRQGQEYFFQGCLDEIRLVKGAAAWTSNFTPPSTPHEN